MTLLSHYVKIICTRLKISHVSSSIVSLLLLVAKLTNPENKNKKKTLTAVFWIVRARSLVYKRRSLFVTCCLIFETELFYL